MTKTTLYEEFLFLDGVDFAKGLILSFIAINAALNGAAKVQVTYMADRFNVSRKTINKHINALVDLGYLSKQPSAAHGQRTTEFCFMGEAESIAKNIANDINNNKTKIKRDNGNKN